MCGPIYLVLLVLWVPVLLAMAVVPELRRIPVAIAVAASAVATAYEAYMTYVWAPTVIAPIRVDIFCVMSVLLVLDGVAVASVAVPALRNDPED